MTAANLNRTESAKALGFWFYLMSDAVIFALLIIVYVTMQNGSTVEGKAFFELGHALLETIILLSSTLTCGLALTSANQQSRPQTQFWLAVTLVLGAAFVVLELQEFMRMIMHNAGPSRNGFLSAFFTLVGTHELHVSVGMLWLMVLMAQITAKGLTRPVYSRLYRWSLFWHFLDLIWVAIFSIVYLSGVL